MSTGSARLPHGWETATLGDTVHERVEQGPPRSEAVPYIDISSVDRATKKIGETQRVNAASAPTRARQWVRAGDVLVSMTRPNLNAVSLVPHHLDGALASTGFDVLRTIGVLPQWVFNRVRTHEFVTDVCRGLQGVVYPAIRPRDVRRHQLPIPPLAEQGRIVASLESYFTRLDDAEATLERVKRNLERYRASVLQAAVEGRLVPTEVKLAQAEGRSIESAPDLLRRVLMAQGDPQRVSPNTADLPSLPSGWTWASVDQLAVEKKIGLVRSVAQQSEAPPGVRYIKMDGIGMDGDLEFQKAVYVQASPVEIQEFLLRDGDILFNTRNSRELVGKSAIVRNPPAKTLFNNNILRLRISPLVSSEFVALQMCSALFRKQIDKVKKATTSVAAVYQRDILPRAIAFPPLMEQRRIAAEVTRLVSVVAVSTAWIDTCERKCGALRRSVLSWGFTGRLSDQDPTDEPAAALLERIRVKRAKAAAAPETSRRRGRPRKAVND